MRKATTTSAKKRARAETDSCAWRWVRQARHTPTPTYSVPFVHGPVGATVVTILSTYSMTQIPRAMQSHVTGLVPVASPIIPAAYYSSANTARANSMAAFPFGHVNVAPAHRGKPVLPKPMSVDAHAPIDDGNAFAYSCSPCDADGGGDTASAWTLPTTAKRQAPEPPSTGGGGGAPTDEKELPVLEKGTKCFYAAADGTRPMATVLKVHYDDLPPYYTIAIDGNERATVRTKLTPVDEASPAQDESDTASTCSLPTPAKRKANHPMTFAPSACACPAHREARPSREGARTKPKTVCQEPIHKRSSLEHLGAACEQRALDISSSGIVVTRSARRRCVRWPHDHD